MIKESDSISLYERKGELGELAFQALMDRLDYHVYRHYGKYYRWDFIICNKSDDPQSPYEVLAYADVKTKPARKKLPHDTGINKAQYDFYEWLQKQSQIPFWIFFVDPIHSLIYQAKIGKTPFHAEPTHEGKMIVYFYLSDMDRHEILPETKAALLEIEKESNNHRSYDYSREIESSEKDSLD